MLRDVAVMVLIVGFSSLAVCWFLRLIERDTEPPLSEADVRLLQWPDGNVQVLSPNGKHGLAEALTDTERRAS